MLQWACLCACMRPSPWVHAQLVQKWPCQIQRSTVTIPVPQHVHTMHCLTVVLCCSRDNSKVT